MRLRVGIQLINRWNLEGVPLVNILSSDISCPYKYFLRHQKQGKVLIVSFDHIRSNYNQFEPVAQGCCWPKPPESSWQFRWCPTKNIDLAVFRWAGGGDSEVEGTGVHAVEIKVLVPLRILWTRMSISWVLRTLLRDLMMFCLIFFYDTQCVWC